MNRFTGVAVVCVLIMISAASAGAQDGGPRTVITPENAPQLEMTAQLGHGTPLALAWSQDGKTLAVGSTAGIWLYDADDFEAEPRLLEGQSSMELSAIAFSPDGTLLASATNAVWEGPVWLWDVATGQTLYVLQGLDNGVQSLVFSPDGKTLATGENVSGRVHLWDAATGGLLEELDRHTGGINDLAYTPDGSRLVSVSQDSTVRGWNERAEEAFPLLEELEEDILDFPLTSVALKPDEEVLAFGGLDWDIRLWDAVRWKPVKLVSHSGGITDLAFSPDGTLLASSSSDHTILLWDMASVRAAMGQPEAERIAETTELTGHPGSVNSIVFNPDGTRLASSSDDGTVRIWDVATGETLTVLGGPSGWVTGLEYSPDGVVLASGYYNHLGGSEGAIQLWDTATDVNLSTLVMAAMAGSDVDVNDVAYRPDGAVLAAASTDTLLWLWDPLTGEKLAELDAYPGDISSVPMVLAFDPVGVSLAAGYGDGMVRLWDAATDQVKFTLEGHTSSVSDVAFSPDLMVLASASLFDRTVRLWDPMTGEGLAVLNISSPQALAYSPDGTTLAVGGFDEIVRLLDATTGQVVNELRAPSGVNCMAYSPDGQVLAAATDQGEVRFWEAATSAELATLHMHYSRVLTLAFHPDGARLVTGGEDGTVKVWAVPEGAAAAPTTPVAQPVPTRADIDQIHSYCTMCHAIGTPDEGVGPSLTGIASRAGSTVAGMSAEEYIRQSLASPSAYVVPGYEDAMPSYAESRLYDERGPEFLETVVAYLLTLTDSWVDIDQILMVCTGCHTIDTPEPGPLGPSLAGIASRAGSTVEGMSAEEYIRQSLSDPMAYMVPGYEVPGFDVVMPAIADILPFFEGTGPNPLDAVVAYLLTLE